MTDFKQNTSQLAAIQQINKAFSDRLQALVASGQQREAALMADFDTRISELQGVWGFEKSNLEQVIDALKGQLESLKLESEARLQTLKDEASRATGASQAEANGYLTRLSELQVSYAELLQDREARESLLAERYMTQLEELRQEYASRETIRTQESAKQLLELQNAWQSEQRDLQAAFGECLEQLQARESRLIESFAEQLEVLRGECSLRENVCRQEAAKHVQDCRNDSLELQKVFSERFFAQEAREAHLIDCYEAQLGELRQSQQASEQQLRRDSEKHLGELTGAWLSEKHQSEQLLESLRGQLSTLNRERLHMEQEVASHLATINKLAGELSSVRNSLLWRLTQPLRWFCAHRVAITPSLPFAELQPVLSSANSPAHNAAEVGDQETGGQMFTENIEKRESTMMLDELLSMKGEAFLRNAYRAILGREADDEGLRSYLRRIAQGYSKASVLHDIARSKEAGQKQSCRDLWGLPDEEFIEAVYKRMLGRHPDPHGKRHYLKIIRGYGGRKRVVNDLKRSDEFAKHNIYAISLQRDLTSLLKEEEALRGWRGWLTQGARIERRINALELAVLECVAAISLCSVTKNGQPIVDVAAGQLEKDSCPPVVLLEPSQHLSPRAKFVFKKLVDKE